MTCLSPKCGLKATSPIKGLCWIHHIKVLFHGKTIAGKRVCSTESCFTFLARSNEGQHCSLHEPPDFSWRERDGKFWHTCPGCSGRHRRTTTKFCSSCDAVPVSA